jgi:hypothetical protein
LEAECGIYSNLGVLLMAAGRLEEALEAIAESIRIAEEEGIDKSPLYAGKLPTLSRIGTPAFLSAVWYSP